MSGDEQRRVDELDAYITGKQRGAAGGEDALVDRLFDLADEIQSKHQPQAMANQSRMEWSGATADPARRNGSMAASGHRKNERSPLSRQRRLWNQPGTRTKWVAGMVPFAAVVALLLAFANAMGGVQSATHATETATTDEPTQTINGADAVTATEMLPPEGTPTVIPMTVSPTPASTEGAAPPGEGPVCYVALDPAIPPGRFVHTIPDPNDTNIIAEIEDGEWVKATGQYSYDQNGNLWLQVEVDGIVGWVMRWYFMFDGRGPDGCTGLESMPASVTPSVPSPTPMPTLDDSIPTPTMPTPTATATPPPIPNASDTYYHVLMGDVGTSASYMHTMGNEAGILNYVNIRVDGIPEDEERYIFIRLDCFGTRVDFQWDMELEVDMMFYYDCISGINVSVMGINPFIPLVVYLPPGDWSTYTFYLEVIGAE